MRRWFQFRLRTLLIAIVLIAPALAWVQYHLNWIDQRRRVVIDWDVGFVRAQSLRTNRPLPFGLWLLGEHSFDGCRLIGTPELQKRIDELFPECVARSPDETRHP